MNENKLWNLVEKEQEYLYSLHYIVERDEKLGKFTHTTLTELRKLHWFYYDIINSEYKRAKKSYKENYIRYKHGYSNWVSLVPNKIVKILNGK